MGACDGRCRRAARGPAGPCRCRSPLATGPAAGAPSAPGAAAPPWPAFGTSPATSRAICRVPPCSIEPWPFRNVVNNRPVDWSVCPSPDIKYNNYDSLQADQRWRGSCSSTAVNTSQAFPYELSGLSSLIGRVIDIHEWADRARIPNRKAPGFLDGQAVERVLGISAKSWDPELFGRIETIAMVARDALASARLAASEVDAVIVVTCSPYESLLDQDSFRLLRMLGIPDAVPPIQLGAGCAGLARA